MKNKSNCLTRALDQWAENPDVFSLWYNSNHVITIEKWYDGKTLIDDDSILGYLPLDDYGFVYFESAFRGWLTPKYRKLLLSYFDSLDDVGRRIQNREAGI